MPGPEQKPEAPDFPEAVATSRQRWRMQFVWLVPIVALLIGAWLAVKAVIEEGPKITISFQTGDGLEAGKTKIKFKDVDIGMVKSVTLSTDHHHVVATADIVKDATGLLVDNTRFWVVRPRISGGTVSGLGTLLSGSYIDMDVGDAKADRRDFIGLEVPPVISSGEPGRSFVLKSADLGSLDVGTPVYYRRLQVGQISDYALDPDGQGVTLRVFINAPYDKYVKEGTRFWHASGLNVTVGTNGLQVDTQSLVSILIGGVAFETPGDAAEQEVAQANKTFTLFSDRPEAFKPHHNIVDKYMVNFSDSVRGLAVGAPVEFRGIVIGEVTAIYTSFDPVTKKLTIPVEFNFYPELFSSRIKGNAQDGRIAKDPRKLGDFLIAEGFRVQLRSGNLLTGQLYIAFDRFPDAPKATIDWNSNPPELPSVPGNLQQLEQSLTQLVAKLNAIPFQEIGQNTRATLQSANALLMSLDAEVVPQARGTLVAAHQALDAANTALQPGSRLQQNTADTLEELTRTAVAFRNLADYLDRHPEALIRGKSKEGTP